MTKTADADATARREELRGKWSDKLYMFQIASSKVEAVMEFGVYFVTRSRSVRFPTTTSGMQMLGPAIFHFPAFDRAAAFFEEKPEATWLILTFTRREGEKHEGDDIGITAWGVSGD